MTWFKRMANLSNDPKVNQGSDGSATYVNNKKCEFVICKWENNSIASFKPFIEKLSYSVETKYTDISEELGVSKKVVLENDSLYFTIDVGLSVVAHSINEALQNVKRINEVSLMYTSIEQNSFYENNNSLINRTIWERNLFVIYLNSLIGRNLDKGVKIESKENLLYYGIPGFLEKYDYTIDKSFGYFEYGGSLIPKKYSINFTFKVSNKAATTFNLENHESTSGKWLWLPYETETGLFPNDCKSFPLGLADVSYGNEGSDGTTEFLNNKKGLLWFGTGINHISFVDPGKENNGVFFSFKPFDLDINKSVSSPNLNLKAQKDQGGTFTMLPADVPVFDRGIKISFSIVNHSINEAIKNTKKLQLLVRLLESYTPDGQDANGNAISWDPDKKRKRGEFRILYNNLISKNFIKNPNNFESFKEQAQLCFLKGFSFEIDKDMGFFEYNGLLLCKKINISLDVKENIPDGRSLGIKTSPFYDYYHEDPINLNEQRSLKKRFKENLSIFKNKESYFKD